MLCIWHRYLNLLSSWVGNQLKQGWGSGLVVSRAWRSQAGTGEYGVVSFCLWFGLPLCGAAVHTPSWWWDRAVAVYTVWGWVPCASDRKTSISCVVSIWRTPSGWYLAGRGTEWLGQAWLLRSVDSSEIRAGRGAGCRCSVLTLISIPWYGNSDKVFCTLLAWGFRQKNIACISINWEYLSQNI